MNLRAVTRMSSLMVAENIMTCIFLGHLRYSFWTMSRMSATKPHVRRVSVGRLLLQCLSSPNPLQQVQI